MLTSILQTRDAPKGYRWRARCFKLPGWHTQHWVSSTKPVEDATAFALEIAGYYLLVFHGSDGKWQWSVSSFGRVLTRGDSSSRDSALYWAEERCRYSYTFGADR